MADQSYYVRGDEDIQESIHLELESERDKLDSGFQEVHYQLNEANATAFNADDDVPADSLVHLVDASSGVVTLTLPALADVRDGKMYEFYGIDTTNNIVIARPAGELMNGADSDFTLASTVADYSSVQVRKISDAIGWVANIKLPA